ncbi:MAG: hypothetical protein US89_C0006G0081 [Candidatus Peregrinibacteria bacterium GW2011_GWF2_38_29]|nr:MAG: hypothetical protein US89_C0006G0081 [Candidatus Peregrinibacteria bacterium GW2011_GWF2_38_29]HBB03272.1 hypothetical protein [Candidatus Peregrinibacteria bacterium]
MKKNLIIFCVIFLVFLYGCGAQSLVTFHTEKGDYRVNVEIASTDEERAKGLMARETLEKDSGMLFVFEEEALRAFWMKNTLIPLDMIFLSANKKIVSITENAAPCGNVEDADGAKCKLYESLKPAKYVIEIAGGEAMKHEIEPGQAVEF